jgi:hypothetical protein
MAMSLEPESPENQPETTPAVANAACHDGSEWYRTNLDRLVRGLCSVADCDSPALAHGMCDLHQPPAPVRRKQPKQATFNPLLKQAKTQ